MGHSWDRLKDVVAEALEQEPAQREAYLKAACAGEEAFRREVESLLAEDGQAGGFLLDAVMSGASRMRPLASGVTLAKRFETIRLIGQGGMGNVYAARDLELGGLVALKTMRPDVAADPRAVARFKSEIQIAKNITHPSVCRIYDFGEDSGEGTAAGAPHDPLLFLTMELVEGETLAQRVARGALSAAECLPLVRQMAAALTAAHDAGVVHRDFKPANVMLAPGRKPGEFRVVVMDFGLAHAIDDSRSTGQPAPVGTPNYMAPEQLTGGPITPATDIFALGIVIYEMVTGRRPFEAETFLDAILKRLNDAPEPPRRFVPDLDPRWERVILRCLKQRSEDRFPSAFEVAAALSGAGASAPAAGVNCASCRHANPSEARFCEECGAALRRSWVVGTARDCHIVLATPTVSGHHARLTEWKDGFLLEDLGSRNGTHVDGARIQEPVLAPWGAEITLGKTPFPWDQVQSAAAGKVLRIGRDRDNDIVLDHPLVSAHHARIRITDNQSTIEDLGSTNGTALGNPEKKITSAPLDPEGTVFFGSLPVRASRLLSGKAALGEAPHIEVALPGSIVFGRDPECKKVLDHPMVSWHHARLSQANGSYTIEDLGSTNGTFVNGSAIAAPVTLAVGDTIGLGSYTFQFTGGSAFQERDHRGNVTIEARGVTVDVPGRRLIEDVSLTIFPSEIVGLMGVAGAGKTTLMSALNGYVRPTGGAVLVNGVDLYRNFAQFRGQIGYAPQDDIMHRELTVSQALYYTAKLRLPRDHTDAAIRSRVSQVLEMLAMRGTEHVIIGSPERKGISGRQRKRVNLAMELLTDPDVLFLDEPTSGLSSEDAFLVMKLLRNLADSGKTILLTIHQPGVEVFRLIDTLAIIGKDTGSVAPGKLVYFGPAYPDAVDFFNPDGVPGARPGVDPSPDEILRGLSKRPSEEWVGRYAASSHKRQYVDQRSGRQSDGPAPDAALAACPHGAPQWGTLVRRCLAVKLQDRAYTGLLLGQSVFVALLVVFVCGTAEKSMAVFGLIMAALFSGCLNASREIVGEWAIYHRERMVELRLLPYIGSKFAVLGGLCVLQCSILAAVVGKGCGLKGDFLVTAGLLTLCSLVALGYGLVISAISRTSERAVALILPILMPMLLLGGALPKLHDATRPVARLLPSRWGFEALLQVQQLDSIRNAFFPASDQFSPAAAAATLAAMLMMLLAILAAVLRSRDVH